MKKILAFLLAVSMILAMAACAAAPAQTTTETAQTEQTEQTPAAEPAAEEPAAEEPASEPAAPAEEENLTETQKIIKEAEGMSLEDLAKKAIEESNGKMFYGVGNSSRGKSALPLFIEYLLTKGAERARYKEQLSFRLTFETIAYGLRMDALIKSRQQKRIVQQLTDFFQKAYDLGYIAAYRFEEAAPALRTIADFSLAPGKVYYPKGLREGGEAAE